MADTVDFDKDKPGALPAGWVAEATAFPWCVKKDVSIADGFVEVKFKPSAGREDQAGAVGVWTKADRVTAFDDFSYGSAAK